MQCNATQRNAALRAFLSTSSTMRREERRCDEKIREEKRKEKMRREEKRCVEKREAARLPSRVRFVRQQSENWNVRVLCCAVPSRTRCSVLRSHAMQCNAMQPFAYVSAGGATERVRAGLPLASRRQREALLPHVSSFFSPLLSGW